MYHAFRSFLYVAAIPFVALLLTNVCSADLVTSIRAADDLIGIRFRDGNFEEFEFDDSQDGLQVGENLIGDFDVRTFIRFDLSTLDQSRPFQSVRLELQTLPGIPSDDERVDVFQIADDGAFTPIDFESSIAQLGQIDGNDNPLKVLDLTAFFNNQMVGNSLVLRLQLADLDSTERSNFYHSILDGPNLGPRLEFTAVPEPTVIGVLICGGVMGWAGRRRSRLPKTPRCRQPASGTKAELS